MRSYRTKNCTLSGCIIKNPSVASDKNLTQVVPRREKMLRENVSTSTRNYKVLLWLDKGTKMMPTRSVSFSNQLSSCGSKMTTLLQASISSLKERNFLFPVSTNKNPSRPSIG